MAIPPIVGLGASAGGLAALKAFFEAVPEDSGMAYVVVVHLTPTQPSMMPELLQKTAHIPVCAASDGQVVEPNHAYVIPPDRSILIYHGRLQVLDAPSEPHALRIDPFLISLAQDQETASAAVILSGTGTDGTRGAREIKALGGVVLVQSEESAGYDGMPRSAINAGLADRVLPPDEMPPILMAYFANATRSGLVGEDRKPADQDDAPGDWISKIFALLRSRLGHDFSVYKRNTMRRRINQRIAVNQIASDEQYARFLRENPAEVDALFGELLIGVTSFFRDRESFDALATRGLPDLFGQLEEGETFRAWVPGCSTGEEVYSLAIILREYLDAFPKRINLQLFGTDLDPRAIAKAREGVFPVGIAADVSEERLKRFFTKEGETFRIRKEVRDCIVFSVQDVLKDPPFSRLSLLSCRNLLIYFGAEAQQRLLPLFHYTLRRRGVLVLGCSETIGSFTSMFEVVDKKWRIYRRKEVPLALQRQVAFPSGRVHLGEDANSPSPVPATQHADIAAGTRQAILEQFAPPAILVSAEGLILHVQGAAGKYLETPSGPPTQNIMDLARAGLGIVLSAALREARGLNVPVTRNRIEVTIEGCRRAINLHIRPQTAPGVLAGRFLVAFEDVAPVPGGDEMAPSDATPTQQDAARSQELEQALKRDRETHQATVEELESANEELKSTNEELQSANEELQSTNEERESTKEELQSLNEELQTLNAELQSKLELLSASRDDMHNLLRSTEIATIFVDNAKRIRWFTPSATTIVNLIPTDIGRPLEHVVSNLSYDGLIKDMGQVLETLVPCESEVQTREGEWFRMRIMPYRTTDNRIDGAVLTFSCIDEQKKAQAILQSALTEQQAAGAVKSSGESMKTGESVNENGDESG